MRGRPHRHPVIESAVFAAAILLSAFIARELWSRRATAAPPPESAGPAPVALNPARPPLPEVAGTRRTEDAVTAVAPIKLTRVQPRKLKPDAVPSPK
jgi:hypothetical protein